MLFKKKKNCHPINNDNGRGYSNQGIISHLEQRPSNLWLINDLYCLWSKLKGGKDLVASFLWSSTEKHWNFYLAENNDHPAITS